MTELKQGLV